MAALVATKVAMVGKKGIYLTGDDRVRVGAKAQPVPVEEAYGGLPKGEARKVRKALHAAGRIDLAKMPRV